MPTAVLVGALDTKREEYEYAADRLESRGIEVILIDTGVLAASPERATLGNERVALAAGTTLEALQEHRDRGRALDSMTAGVRALVADLVRTRPIDGFFALGGTGGTAVASAVFADLPLGMPKVIVSTAASGNTANYIRESDLTLIPSVTDVAGLNPLFRTILDNAVNAFAGQILFKTERPTSDRPMIAASMFGVTTPCVTSARHILEAAGDDVLVFHMTGAGGRMLERLVRDAWVEAVLDITTTELADELVGGIFSAGPSRLTGARDAGVPQVVSVGALDMVNFGPIDEVPERFRSRNLYRHNASITLMRTTPEECERIGHTLVHRVVGSRAPVAVYLPLRGVSALSVEGQPFFDPAADEALFSTIRADAAREGVEVVERDTDINAAEFAAELAQRLLSMSPSREGAR